MSDDLQVAVRGKCLIRFATDFVHMTHCGPILIVLSSSAWLMYTVLLDVQLVCRFFCYVWFELTGINAI